VMMARSIMVDPKARTVSEIEVPLADEPDAGPQVNFNQRSIRQCVRAGEVASHPWLC